MDETLYVVAMIAGGFAYFYWRYTRVKTRRFIHAVEEKETPKTGDDQDT